MCSSEMKMHSKLTKPVQSINKMSAIQPILRIVVLKVAVCFCDLFWSRNFQLLSTIIIRIKNLKCSEKTSKFSGSDFHFNRW